MRAALLAIAVLCSGIAVPGLIGLGVQSAVAGTISRDILIPVGLFCVAVLAIRLRQSVCDRFIDAQRERRDFGVMVGAVIGIGFGLTASIMVAPLPPLVQPFVAIALVTAATVLGGYVGHRLLRKPLVEEGRCSQCGYDLRGCVEPRCPECGMQFVASESSSHEGQ
jgi:uncharacterized membrane protein YfcA